MTASHICGACSHAVPAAYHDGVSDLAADRDRVSDSLLTILSEGFSLKC